MAMEPLTWQMDRMIDRWRVTKRAISGCVAVVVLALCSLGLTAGVVRAADIVVVDDTTFVEAEWVYDKAASPDECLVLFDPAGFTVCGQGGDEPSADLDARTFAGTSEISDENHMLTELIVGAHVTAARAYSPSTSGAVQSVTGGFAFWAGRATQGVTSTITGHLLVEQGGEYYISTASVSVTSGSDPSGFSPLAAPPLSAGDFDRVSLGGIDPTSHPDFSEAGADLHFGFAVDLTWVGPFPDNPFVADFLVRSFRIDQYGVTVTVADPPSVPAGGLVMRGVLLGSLALFGAVRAGRRRT